MRPPLVQRFSAVVVAAALAVTVAPHIVTGAHGVASAETASPNGQGDLVVVGDSLTEGAEYFGSLRKSLLATGIWPRVNVDYKRGRTVRQGIPVLVRQLDRAQNPTAIIVALGTNDMMSHSEPAWPARVIDELMATTRGLPVLWVNVTFDTARHPDWKARANRFNRTLVSAASRWPNLTVANWSRGFVPAGRYRFISDGVHLTVSAYRQRAAWIATQSREFGRRAIDSSTTTSTTTSTSTSTSTSSTSTTTTTSPVTTTT